MAIDLGRSFLSGAALASNFLSDRADRDYRNQATRSLAENTRLARLQEERLQRQEARELEASQILNEQRRLENQDRERTQRINSGLDTVTLALANNTFNLATGADGGELLTVDLERIATNPYAAQSAADILNLSGLGEYTLEDGSTATGTFDRESFKLNADGTYIIDLVREDGTRAPITNQRSSDPNDLPLQFSAEEVRAFLDSTMTNAYGLYGNTELGAGALRLDLIRMQEDGRLDSAIESSYNQSVGILGEIASDPNLNGQPQVRADMLSTAALDVINTLNPLLESLNTGVGSGRTFSITDSEGNVLSPEEVEARDLARRRQAGQQSIALAEQAREEGTEPGIVSVARTLSSGYAVNENFENAFQRAHGETTEQYIARTNDTAGLQTLQRIYNEAEDRVQQEFENTDFRNSTERMRASRRLQENKEDASYDAISQFRTDDVISLGGGNRARGFDSSKLPEQAPVSATSPETPLTRTVNAIPTDLEGAREWFADENNLQTLGQVATPQEIEQAQQALTSIGVTDSASLSEGLRTGQVQEKIAGPPFRQMATFIASGVRNAQGQFDPTLSGNVYNSLINEYETGMPERDRLDVQAQGSRNDNIRLAVENLEQNRREFLYEMERDALGDLRADQQEVRNTIKAALEQSPEDGDYLSEEYTNKLRPAFNYVIRNYSIVDDATIDGTDQLFSRVLLELARNSYDEFSEQLLSFFRPGFGAPLSGIFNNLVFEKNAAGEITRVRLMQPSSDGTVPTEVSMTGEQYKNYFADPAQRDYIERRVEALTGG